MGCGCMKGSHVALPEEEVQNFLDTVEGTKGSAVFYLFRDASPTVRAHRGCALAAVSKWGAALYYVGDRLKADEEVVLAAVCQNGEALYNAANHFRDHREVVLAAVAQSGKVLEYASDSLKQDPEVVMVASASAEKYLDQRANYWSNRDKVMSVVKRKGEALKFAAEHLRADKDVVLAAVAQSSSSLKYAKGGLNQNAECLKASGLWDPTEIAYSRTEKAILSVKFSLEERSSKYATEFAMAMKRDPFLKNFKTYNPNTHNKKTCDPDYTSMDHPCRGTLATCTLPDCENLMKDFNGQNKPGNQSCWRFAFRFHMEKCKASRGFMIQVEEKEGGLGKGQEIETEMAKEVELKVFRTYTNDESLEDTGKHSYNGMDAISNAVQEWYAAGCTNDDMENVFIGNDQLARRMPDVYGYEKRPREILRKDGMSL